MRNFERSLIIVAALACARGADAQRVPSAAPPPLRTLSAEEAAALDELTPRFAAEIPLIQGWFRDRIVLYYGFNDLARPAKAGQVFWPIHGFDARGNPVAIRGQRPIFSSIPGIDGYSGVWRLFYVVTADNIQPNQLRDVVALENLVQRKRASMRETDLTLNLPIVARGSRLARDSTPAMMGWYKGRDVQFFDFGEVSLTPVAMWRFARGPDVAGEPVVLADQNSIVDSIPVSPAYPDLWEIRFVRVDSAYVGNTLKSAEALRTARVSIDAPSSLRNLPITIIDGAKVPRTRSPISTFADLRSPFPPAPTPPQ